MNYSTHIDNPDIILVGSGVMSANLAALLKRLQPTLKIQVYEVTSDLAQESSHGWNNAGTGHAGICELSYTPHREADGTVNVANAIKIFEQFERTKQFWSYALASGMIDRPTEFINPVQHLSFVHGEAQVAYLKARHAGLAAHHFFKGIEFSTDRATIGSWAPLLTEGRAEGPIAATKMDCGTDVNFGNLSRKLLGWLARQEGCGIASHHRVVDLTKTATGWDVSIQDLATGQLRQNRAKFVFVGAGGGSLHLLQKSGIAEARGLGGFPIGGQWLVCDDRQGSVFDLPGSVKPHNLTTLLKIGASNLGLVRYLVQQGTQSMADRMKVLHIFYPTAKASDWKLIDAGIRVQAIKKTDGEAGIVHYGTEVITNPERTISALLGASPGASVCVHIVLDVIKQCFPDLISSPEGRARLKEMIPTHDVDIKLPEHAAFFKTHSDRAEKILGLA